MHREPHGGSGQVEAVRCCRHLSVCLAMTALLEENSNSLVVWLVFFFNLCSLWKHFFASKLRLKLQALDVNCIEATVFSLPASLTRTQKSILICLRPFVLGTVGKL